MILNCNCIGLIENAFSKDLFSLVIQRFIKALIGNFCKIIFYLKVYELSSVPLRLFGKHVHEIKNKPQTPFLYSNICCSLCTVTSM